MHWNGNLNSSIGKSARLVIWISEDRIPVQVRIFLLKSEIIILQGTHYKLLSAYKYRLFLTQFEELIC